MVEESDEPDLVQLIKLVDKKATCKPCKTLVQPHNTRKASYVFNERIYLRQMFLALARMAFVDKAATETLVAIPLKDAKALLKR